MGELTRELVDMLKEWLEFAEDKFSEFDVEGDDCENDGTLCSQCQSNGCIQRKIRLTRALVGTPCTEQPK